MEKAQQQIVLILFTFIPPLLFWLYFVYIDPYIKKKYKQFKKKRNN